MLCFFFFKIYLFMIERERQRHRRREKQAPCRKPDVGLDPGTPGSCPGPKAGAKPLSHPGIPPLFFLAIYLFMHERHTERERGRDTGRGRSRLHAGSPTWDSILGLQDHAPGCRRRQTAAPRGLPKSGSLNRLTT